MSLYKYIAFTFNFFAMAMIVACASVSFPAYSGLAEVEGFDGYASILIGSSGSTSNLSTEQPAKLMGNEGETHKFHVIPMGNIHLSYGDKLQYQTYIGSVKDDVAVGLLSFQIGQKFQSRGGVLIDISYLPTLLSRDVWKDPYTLSAPREETSETGHAYRLKFGNLLTGKLGFEFALVQNQIKDEEILDPSLFRAADTIISKIDYKYPLNIQLALNPSVSFIRHNAEGSAASYKAVSTDLTFLAKLIKQNLSLKISTQFFEYDDASYEFLNIRKDTRLGAIFAHEYHPDILSRDWGVISLLKYEKTVSNIDFYDSQEWLISTGLSYKF